MKPRTLQSLAVVMALAGVVAACGAAAAPQVSQDFDAAPAIAAIGRALPRGWSVAETRFEEIPFGHYSGTWSGRYASERGTMLIVMGLRPVSIRWIDRAGNEHVDPIAVEALDLWLMPPGYRNDWRTLLTFAAPPQPDRLFADGAVRVYGRPSSHMTIPDRRFREGILLNAVELRWPDSPGNPADRLSWHTWQQDLRQALASRNQ